MAGSELEPSEELKKLRETLNDPLDEFATDEERTKRINDMTHLDQLREAFSQQKMEFGRAKLAVAGIRDEAVVVVGEEQRNALLQAVAQERVSRGIPDDAVLPEQTARDIHMLVAHRMKSDLTAKQLQDIREKKPQPTPTPGKEENATTASPDEASDTMVNGVELMLNKLDT